MSLWLYKSNIIKISIWKQQNFTMSVLMPIPCNHALNMKTITVAHIISSLSYGGSCGSGLMP